MSITLLILDSHLIRKTFLLYNKDRLKSIPFIKKSKWKTIKNFFVKFLYSIFLGCLILFLLDLLMVDFNY